MYYIIEEYNNMYYIIEEYNMYYILFCFVIVHINAGLLLITVSLCAKRITLLK